MATRSQIQNLIDTNLADESDIHAVEHREVENAFLGQFYDNVITENSGNPPVILSPMQANLTYSIRIKKVGNIVFMSGRIWKHSGAAINQTSNLFDIIDSEYVPNFATRMHASAIGTIPNQPAVPYSIGVEAGVSRIITYTYMPIAPAIMHAIYFNGFYFVNP